jgi:membrane protein
MGQTGGILEQIRHFFSETLWQPLPPETGGLKANGLPLLRMVVLTAQGYRENRSALRASALSLYSLLALVPVAAMAIGIAQGFGFERRLEATLMERFAGQEEVFQYVITFARKLLENTRGGVVAGIGVGALFWAVIKVLGQIESAFNHIWKVPSRTWERRFADYLAIMLLGPLLLITASSATVYLQTQVTAMADRLHLPTMVGPVIALAFKLGPYLLMWVLFSLVYMVMPNTRVRLWSGLLAGLIAGTIFQLAQSAYIDLQILVSKYNAVYGSFAALPLFLIWLQLSWLIVLVGAEVAHTHQHRQHLARLRVKREHSHREQQLLAVRLCRRIVQRYSAGDPPLDLSRLAEALDLTEAELQAPLDALVANGILNRVLAADDEPGGYQPGRDPELITLAHILAALDMGPRVHTAPPDKSGSDSQRALDAFLKAQLDTPANLRIKDI